MLTAPRAASGVSKMRLMAPATVVAIGTHAAQAQAGGEFVSGGVGLNALVYFTRPLLLASARPNSSRQPQALRRHSVEESTEMKNVGIRL